MDDERRLSRSLWIGIALLIIILCVAYLSSQMEARRAPNHALPVLGQVADFTLTNQNDRMTRLADLRGHVWVADIIFTRCAGPCPRMTQQMKELQKAVPAASQTRLVTLTTDPDFDTPQILKTYSERFGANLARWTFLTGAKKQIAALATGSLKLSAVEVKPDERQNAEDLFVHSTIFVVVDKQARLRGVFETMGDGVEWTNVQPRILATVQRLEHEP